MRNSMIQLVFAVAIAVVGFGALATAARIRITEHVNDGLQMSHQRRLLDNPNQQCDSSTSVPCQAQPTCQTSGGSPNYNDAKTLISGLSWETCENTNSFGSKCTTIDSYGEANISICSGSTSGDTGSICSTMNNYITQLVDKCKQKFDGVDRTGGLWNIGNDSGSTKWTIEIW